MVYNRDQVPKASIFFGNQTQTDQEIGDRLQATTPAGNTIKCHSNNIMTRYSKEGMERYRKDACKESACLKLQTKHFLDG